ncbi:hypothetical protein VTK73DRAFT_7302 [Phialemonium thermophilum]|uniref:Guanyl-nucleotide exchange factor n=1 Tax=Phialemonium thermophilum TaxID=223376 RepID=A0ABR3WFF7_9PEZI
MPFLRRRGNMASESDMRRHSSLDHSSLTKSPPSYLRPDPGAAPAAGGAVAEHGSVPPIPAPLSTPPTDARSSTSSSIHPVSSAAHSLDRPATPPLHNETPKQRRFSMLRFRNASDSQLAAKAKQMAAADKPPPVPRPPEIITTAPTFDINVPKKKPSRIKLAARFRRSSELPRGDGHPDSAAEPVPSRKDRRKSMAPEAPSRHQTITFREPKRDPASHTAATNGEDNSSALAVPTYRLSESSRSDASSHDHGVNGGGSAAATHNTHTATSSFFRLSRRKKKEPPSLFPISHLKPSAEPSASDSFFTNTEPESSGANGSNSRPESQQATTTSRPPSSHDAASLAISQLPTLGTHSKNGGSPATALLRPGSRNSVHSSPTRTHLHLRGRSSTLSSLSRNSPRASVDEHLAPPTTRTSSSIGRKSFGDLLSLSRLRQNSEPSGRGGSLTPATPGSGTSKNNSLQIARESVVLPERREDDTPAKYLARLEEVVSRSVIAAAVSKSADPFFQAVLRSYMRRFGFFGDPMDMAIRKLLMEAELPKETQHIDRFLQAFANRYHECNPGIYASPDQAYFIAFSLLILHTDVFNKNNKHKMQKADYLKNTQDEGIFHEILEVFYDNISYTPFIHVEDDFDINGDRIVAAQHSQHSKGKRKSLFPHGSIHHDVAAPKKVAKEPIDPYTLIIDGNLDLLRPNLRDVMHLEDHYSYLGTAKSLNMKELQKTFFKTGILQIVSPRSRPDAFMSEKTATNPDEAHPGIVDIKITKVGLLWRKDVKKKKTRSPWQEWGAILTGAQLYFFRNTAWVKGLMHQFEAHIKQGHDGIPIIFKPPLEQFKPDALMSTDGAVALLDSTYKKHKHAFVYVRHGGFEEVLLADNEDEMNDWLAKLNYAAAFRTSGVRMRGVVGGTYDGQGRRALRRLDATAESEGIQTPTGEVTVARSRIDHKMAQDILAARREIMRQKIAEANEKLESAEKHLELQLRNARHLQILAPIHPKTRENMLLSAARLAAQLKWTRMEIWRLKCHRDILLMDLEEERALLGLPVNDELVGQEVGGGAQLPDRATTTTMTTTASATTTTSALTRPESKESSTAPRQRSPPRSPLQLSLRRSSSAVGRSDVDSPSTEVFQTPPTSARTPGFQEVQQQQPDASVAASEKKGRRKASVSSAVSSHQSIMATPPRKIASSGSAPERRRLDPAEEADAEEHDLLAKTGLIDVATPRPADGKQFAADAEQGQEQREQRTSASHSDRTERSKLRRSLQRTLRESAGHLSHHRSSRKGKDASATAVGGGGDGSGNAAGEEGSLDAADVLARGSGSFVVHGKKASVITFGAEFQGIPPDEQLRLRNKSLQQQQQQQAAAATAVAAQQAEGGSATNGGGGDTSPIVVTTARLPRVDRDGERRESATSTSTSTALSFRELHRKYSSARAAGTAAAAAAVAVSAASGAATLVVPPSDTDSEIAVSFSEGRRTPLPPIEGEAESGADDTESGGSDTSSDEDDESATKGGKRHGVRETQFFTPEPPASPAPSGGAATDGEDRQGRRDEIAEGGKDRLPSPPIQAVGA